MPSQKKIDIVSSIADKIKSSSHFVLFGFEKTPHNKLEELRRSLADSSVDSKITFQVIKNSLLKVAAKKIGKEAIIKDDVTRGPSALMSLPADWTAGLNAFYKFAKGTDTLVFKIGVIDETIYEKNELMRLAQLPSRQELVAKIVGSLRSPHTRLAYALKFNMTKLVYILRQKGSG